mmetsp:Transcript_5273/g.6778  ORF Transcript_5273/g.6778 Transcript_5273/m.6778 type:complete len:80 (+) Transcript_5273:69-308(+)
MYLNQCCKNPEILRMSCYDGIERRCNKCRPACDGTMVATIEWFSRSGLSFFLKETLIDKQQSMKAFEFNEFSFQISRFC